MADAEVQRPTQIARPQEALGKWSGFANGVPGYRDHVEEGTGVHVDELAEQVLIHVDGIFGIPADGFLNTGVEGEDVPSEVHRWIQPEVERNVGSVAVDDRVGAWQ